jgi:MerR family copper efflux transcriptional regulator
MNIGEAARASGLTVKKIRHYEAIGMVPAANRLPSGYRDYSEDDVHRFQFVRRGRELGFSIEHIRGLLRLWSDRRSDAQVRAIALEHVAEMEEKAARLREMIAVLRGLAQSCAKGDRAHCPIIEKLDGGKGTAPSKPSRRH